MARMHSQQRGVTLIELMIATTIFSVVLVIVIYAFLFVSEDYVKGSVESQTQETARSILESVSQDIQLNNAGFAIVPPSGSVKGYCIGNHLYSYQYNDELGTSQAPSHDLLMTSSSDCNSPSVYPSLSGAGTELLGDHMRLGDFCVSPSASVTGQYTISITVAYGDDSKTQSGPLTYTATPDSVCGGTKYTYTCPDINVDGDFCATSTLETVVQQRVTD